MGDFGNPANRNTGNWPQGIADQAPGINTVDTIIGQNPEAEMGWRDLRQILRVAEERPGSLGRYVKGLYSDDSLHDKKCYSYKLVIWPSD